MATIEQLQKQLAAAQQRSGASTSPLIQKNNQTYIDNLKGQIGTMIVTQKPKPIVQPTQTKPQPKESIQSNTNLGGTVNNNTNVVGGSNNVGNLNNSGMSNNAGQTQPTVTYTPEDYTKYIDQWKANQLAMRQNTISDRYNQLKADIEAKQRQVAPQYEAKRLNEQSGSQLQAKNFAEFLANRGLSRSGTSAQAELMRNLQLKQTYNALNKQEADDLAYYGKQIDDANRSYTRDLNSAEQEIESDYLGKMMSEKARQDELKYKEMLRQEENAYKQKQLEREMLKTNYDIDKDKREEAIKSFTTKASGFGYDYDFDSDINAILNDGDATNDWQADILRNQKRASTNEMNKELKDFYKGSGYTYNPITGEFMPSYEMTKDEKADKTKQREAMLKESEAFTKATGYYNPYYGVEIPSEIRTQLEPYSDNYAKFSNETSDPTLAYYSNVASVQKMMDNPQLRQQYGGQFLSQEGMKNYLEQEKTKTQTVGFELDNIIKSTEFEYLKPTLQAKLEKAQEEVNEARIKNQFLPQEKAAEIQQTIASANASLMNAETSRMNANRGNEKFEFEKQQTLNSQDEKAYKDIDNYIMNNYRNGTNYDEKTGTYKDAFTVQDKKDISAYLDNLAVQGTPVSIVKSLKVKYGVK